ncbi:hypothetical protein ACOZ4N_00910 (plasmid) [Halorientalis pallida]|uniref:hypothetical protein n=1 Tax=Halorientalis pallida TaxID=2479928 RepID=UPI003C6FB7D5
MPSNIAGRVLLNTFVNGAGPPSVWGSQLPVFVPLSSVADALSFPPWLGTATVLAGLCVLGIGSMAWMSALGPKSRMWGQRTTLMGVLLTIVGFGFATLTTLIRDVLTP